MSKTKETKVWPAATMTPATVPQCPDVAYELVKNLVFDQVHKFHRMYGGDKDELAGTAGVAFVRGHAQFVTGHTKSGRPIKEAYATKIRMAVWYTMFDVMRARIAKNDATEAIVDRDFACEVPAIFDREDFEDGMGEDARRVVGLLLDPPSEVERVSEAKGGDPRNLRSTVRQYLVKESWSTDRINAAFNQVRNQLTEV
jgi:hypothetical protein